MLFALEEWGVHDYPVQKNWCKLHKESAETDFNTTKILKEWEKL